MSTRAELARFGAIGVASNAVLYLAYLAITALGIGHKTAMSVVYCAGVLQTFALNRKWTFRRDGAWGGALARYWVVYAAGYAVNLALLAALVDAAGWPHQLVQAGAIVLIALLTFVAQKYWVFRA